ncbi:hypothetical protein N7456_005656 [Penicillium angulare]|uniref:Uncharacterized protein n=1 Tax=Penicillium angulare TaxID=116970 RepID=A0A9W9FYY5_9EURO|nr:hypothetical protein N7456_005656 [Penicillium angulare]
MVYYIRFLKPPKFHQEKDKKNPKQSRPQQKKTVFIAALICITTDLGDDFLAEDVDLVATWEQRSSRQSMDQCALKWQAGCRQVSISMGPYSVDHVAQHEAVLHIRPQAIQVPQDVLGIESTPLVISGCSAPFQWHAQSPKPAEKLIKRELRITDSDPALSLNIWEETGNSIARHIWDAALASIIFLNEIITGASTSTVTSSGSGTETETGSISIPILSQLLKPLSRSKPLQVVELGAGCGIVGIGLATMLDGCKVLLTDLPEVEEIVMRNLDEAHLKPSSTVDFQTLDWDAPPSNLCSQPIDLILVSDCTYNADSLPSLVSVLGRLVRTSPEALVLVALKRRHESEGVFFDLMRSAGFKAQHTSIELPTQHEQRDEIEFYCYRADERE